MHALFLRKSSNVFVYGRDKLQSSIKYVLNTLLLAAFQLLVAQANNFHVILFVVAEF